MHRLSRPCPPHGSRGGHHVMTTWGAAKGGGGGDFPPPALSPARPRAFSTRAPKGTLALAARKQDRFPPLPPFRSGRRRKGGGGGPGMPREREPHTLSGTPLSVWTDGRTPLPKVPAEARSVISTDRRLYSGTSSPVSPTT